MTVTILDLDEIRKIQRLYDAGHTAETLAFEFDVSPSTIRRALHEQDELDDRDEEEDDDDDDDEEEEEEEEEEEDDRR